MYEVIVKTVHPNTHVHFTREVKSNATNPFLSECVLEVVDSGVPRLTKSEQASRPEARLSHNGKVCVEGCTDLDQSELTV